MDRFKNQTVMIAGGAQGIGLAAAHRLGQEGARLILLDLVEESGEQAARELEAAGHSARFIPVDVTSPDRVNRVFSDLEREGIALDAVVHTAGVVGPNGLKSGDVQLSDFETTIRVNLIGSFIILQAALKLMLPRNYGRILFLASVAGKEGNAGMSPYSSSKAGVIGMVKSAGKEYAESGVTINALAPATIMTPMVEGMEPAQIKYMTDKIPMKRCGQLDEIAGLIAYIISKENSFTTGFTYDMTGGRAVY